MLIENEDPEISGEQKILCIDPDQDVLDQLEKSLTLNSFQVITAKSPGEGMEMMVKFSPEVIITEIIFPELEGPQFLRVLRRINHSAAIIVHTRDTNFDIDKQCGSCFEKIKKPVLLHELIAIVRKAFAFTKNLNIVDELELESSQRMKNQLEWLIWKERSKLTSKISLGKAMIHNIKHSISQGMGVGSLVTQIEMLDLGKKKDENCYKVAAGSFDFLIKASSEVRDWIDHLDRIANIFGVPYSQEKISYDSMYESIEKSLECIESFRKIKNHTIVKEKGNFDISLMANKLVIEMSMRELLTNAFKYSPANSKIKIIQFVKGNFYSILIMNTIQSMNGGISGIPEEFENEIFEPYFRLNNVYDERFNKEELGMGIGLTVIQGAINQVGGSLSVYEILDHTSNGKPERKVIAEMIFPVYHDSPAYSLNGKTLETEPHAGHAV